MLKRRALLKREVGEVSHLAMAKLPAERAGLTALDSIVRRLADHEAVNEQC